MSDTEGSDIEEFEIPPPKRMSGVAPMQPVKHQPQFVKRKTPVPNSERNGASSSNGVSRPSPAPNTASIQASSSSGSGVARPPPTKAVPAQLLCPPVRGVSSQNSNGTPTQNSNGTAVVAQNSTHSTPARATPSRPVATAARTAPTPTPSSAQNPSNGTSNGTFAAPSVTTSARAPTPAVSTPAPSVAEESVGSTRRLRERTASVVQSPETPGKAPAAGLARSSSLAPKTPATPQPQPSSASTTGNTSARPVNINRMARRTGAVVFRPSAPIAGPSSSQPGPSPAVRPPRVLLANIYQSGEWKRDPSKDTATSVAYFPSNHRITKKELAELKKNPHVIEKMNKYPGKKTSELTFVIPYSYVVCDGEEYEVACFNLPSGKNPAITCHWPPQDKQEDITKETLKKLEEDVVKRMEKQMNQKVGEAVRRMETMLAGQQKKYEEEIAQRDQEIAELKKVVGAINTHLFGGQQNKKE